MFALLKTKDLKSPFVGLLGGVQRIAQILGKINRMVSRQETAATATLLLGAIGLVQANRQDLDLAR